MQDTDDLMNDIRKSPNIYIKEVRIKTQKAFRTANRHHQRRNSPQNTIIRMSKMQNKEISLELSVLSPQHLHMVVVVIIAL